ncbi:MAG TPA: tetratricopeptide repeat protein [Gemmatimonadaceae bacterium]|jgi:tetratricopeptide (TPR) repeat protein
MANSALIEDLRKQFAENPRRVFARLANEYRKSGDLDVAIEICRAHVPLQPTYISGYIVLGQALFERGQADEARSTFETALTLDPENLIALRQLGDIARVSGDLDAARGWYHKLLEVDPQNDEIMAQLEALEAPTRSTSSPTPAAVAAVTPSEAAPVSWNDIHPDSNEAVTPLAPQATQPTRPRFTIGVIPDNLTAEKDTAPASQGSSTSQSPPAPAIDEMHASADATEPDSEPNDVSSHLPEIFGGFDRHSPIPPEQSTAFSDSSSERELTFDASEMTPDSAEASAPELMDISDLAPMELDDSAHESEDESSPVELSPLATTAEFSVPAMPTAPATPRMSAAPPATAAELSKLFAGPELETSSVDSTSGRDDGHTFEEEPYDPTVGRMLELSHRTSSDALLPDLMMTESGAELLREQGHIEQAIYVYRHLAAKNPQDTSYAERIAALERGAHSSIPLIASISEEVISAARNRPHSTGSIRSFFTSFATRRLPEGAEGESEPAVQAIEPAAVSAADTESAAPTPAEAPASVASAPAEPPQSMSDEDRSALETLFSGKPRVASTDERAAAALASAFSEEFAAESTGPAGQPTRAASDALSLDAVFQNTRARADGEHRASQPAVSFDEFFANREHGNGAGDGKADAAIETASRSDDSQSDLELFHEWLDGLKK